MAIVVVLNQLARKRRLGVAVVLYQLACKRQTGAAVILVVTVLAFLAFFR